MNKFSFNDDRNLKIRFLKKLGIIIVVFIVIFLILRGCNNFLLNKIREDINKDKITKIESETKEEVDLNKPFSYYNIKNEIELDTFIEKIAKYLKPKELQKYIDYSLYEYKYVKESWNEIDNLYEILNELPEGSYANLLKQLIDNKVNYDEAPLTDSFRKKLKDGILNDYQLFNWDGYDFEKRYFILSDYNGEAQDDYYFNFILDEEGYLDDIILDHIEPMYDKGGIYIPKKDSKLMNNEKDIELIISQILLSEDQYVFDGDEGYYYMNDPQSRYNRFKEFGFTDRFREYYASFNGKGLIDDKLDDRDDIYVENIDIENKTAVVKLVFHKLNIIKYYDVSWSTDDKYRLDTINVKFNREENK